MFQSGMKGVSSKPVLKLVLYTKSHGNVICKISFSRKYRQLKATATGLCVNIQAKCCITQFN